MAAASGKEYLNKLDDGDAASFTVNIGPNIQRCAQGDANCVAFYRCTLSGVGRYFCAYFT